MMIKLKVESLKLKGFCFAAVLLFSTLSFAQSEFDLVNAAYADGRYEEAAAGYEALLAENELFLAGDLVKGIQARRVGASYLELRACIASGAESQGREI